MHAAIPNKIRGFEPQRVLYQVVQVQRKLFYERNCAALAFTLPVPATLKSKLRSSLHVHVRISSQYGLRRVQT